MLGELPTEILESIFRASDQKGYEASRLQYKLLALVCRRFRVIVTAFRYETLFCEEPKDHLRDPWEANPFSKALKKHPWKAALVKNIFIEFFESRINFVVEFPNLVSLDVSHEDVRKAFKCLPMQENLFPNLRRFNLSSQNWCSRVCLSEIARIWIQQKLEIFSMDSVGLILDHGETTFKTDLPPLKLMRIAFANFHDVDISTLLSIRGVEELVILECCGSFPLMIASAKNCLQSLTLVDGGWTNENLFRCLNPDMLKQLHVDVKHFLVCEYGESNTKQFGRQLREHLARRENGLELLSLEQLTIIFDGVQEIKSDYPMDAEDMVWTPSIFRHIMESVQELAPRLQKVVYKFYVPMYEALYEDFPSQIADLERIGRADGLNVELELYENDLTLEPSQENQNQMAFHDAEHLRSLLNTRSKGKEKKRRKRSRSPT